MIGLIVSQLILFAVAGVAGLAIGWRARAYVAATQARARARDVADMRAALTEAQVRRARGA